MSGWQLPLVGLALVLILVCALAAIAEARKRHPFLSNAKHNAHRLTRTLPDNWLKDFKERKP